MEKLILTILSAATFAVLDCFAITQYTKDDFTYSYVVGTGEAKVDKYSGSGSSVNIPSSFTIKVGTYSDGRDKFETFHVTGISPGAFRNNKTITSVSWPSRLKAIEGNWAAEGYYRGGAFEGCSNLADIPSLEGITTIGSSAFQGCAGIKSVEIPSTVTSLAKSAFQGCTGLKTAIVNYSGALPSGMFAGCTSLESLVLGDGIVEIEGAVSYYITGAPRPLSGCSNLKSISLGRGITTIPESFVSGLSLLERVMSSGAIKFIGDSAFSGCTSIIEIPSLSAVTNIGQNAFYNCGSLSGSVNIPRCKKIDKNAFRYCYGISEVELGEPLTEIGEYAFNSCTSLYTVKFSGAPPTAYDNSFMNLKSGALGLYTTLYANEWRERINDDGTWHRLIMQPMYPIQPPTLTATQYHDQHPQGVKLTWPRVDGAPGYVIFRKIVGEREFQSVFATTATEYIDKVATIPNVKDFKAQYTVAVAVWSGSDRGSIRYLSVQSKPALGCWKERVCPYIKALTQDSKIFLTDEKGMNKCRIELNAYDRSRYAINEARLTATRNGTTRSFVISRTMTTDPVITFDLPAGEHGEWVLTGQCIFRDIKTRNDYPTSPYSDRFMAYFRREGKDGIQVADAKSEQGQLVPNWFKYWLRDGALDLLKDDNLYYGKNTDWGKMPSENTGAWTWYDGKINVFDAAISTDFSSEIRGGIIKLHTRGLTGINSISNCAEVIEHERWHRQLFETRKVNGINRGRNDQKWLELGIDSDKDGIAALLETSFANTYKEMTFDTNNPDTFNFYNVIYGESALEESKRSYQKEDCDEEVYVRYLATISHRQKYFDNVIHAEKDYSWDDGDVARNNQKRLSVTSNSLGLYRNVDDMPIFDSGFLDSEFRFGGASDAEYEDENLTILSVDSIEARQGQNGSSYDSLVVTVVIAARQKDYGTIVVSLLDALDNPVAWAGRCDTINAGTNQLEIVVDGNILHDSKKNGYKVNRVVVFGGKGNFNNPRAMLNSSVSSVINYKWSDFASDTIMVDELVLCSSNNCVNVNAEIVVPNEGGVYDLSSYLCNAGTHGYVAEASQTNVVLHVGTNIVSLAFANSDIQMNAVSNAFAISKFTVEKDGEIVAAYRGNATIEVVDETILNPSNAVLTFDSATIRNELVTADGGALYSGINFAFDIVNLHTNTVDYSLMAYLHSTNSLAVDIANFDVSLTSGVNHITIPFLGTEIRASESDGPYMLSCVRLESKDDAIANQTLRMNSITPECAAADFQGNVIETIVGVSRSQNRNNSIVANVSFTTSGTVSGLVKASLIDANDNVVAFGCGEFATEGAGTTKAAVAFAISNITASAYSMPLRVAYISIEPADKLVIGLYDDTIELQISDIYYNYYVDATNGDDENTGNTFDAARKTLQSAVADAEDGDTVFVKSGMYSPIRSQNKSITIVSIDGNANTIIDGGGEACCANLGSDASQTNTMLVGFTLRNGLYSTGGGACGGKLKNCIVEGNKAIDGGGGVCYSVLEDCQLRNNVSECGGGAYMSMLRRCLVSGNEAMGLSGGGMKDTAAYDCVVQGNAAATAGGGADHSSLYNCTVIGNSAVGCGGGVSDGMVMNSIVWGNTAATSNNHYRAQGVYNCTTPLLPGDGNIESDPLLRGAEFGGFMLSVGSPCIDAGLDDGEWANYYYGTGFVSSMGIESTVSDMDFFGQERMQGAHVDMGAVEGVTNACLVMTRSIGHGSLDVSYELWEPHSSITITADESIRPIDHFETNDGRVFTGSQVQLDNITSDTFLTAYFKYYDFYVDAKNGDDENDGFSWATAKRTIQSAIDSAVGGEKIMVAKGMYEPIATADKAVVIESVSGASLTFINGGGTNRCASLLSESASNYSAQTNTVIMGFTLMNGRATSGAGAYGGTLHDCVIKSNVAADSGYCYGGGTYYGVQYNCRYEGNSVSAAMYGYGGAACYGTSYNCSYANNSAYGQTNAWGGATCYGTHYDCDINHNIASRCGGGAYGGTYYRTAVSDNEAPYGGGCGKVSFYDGEIKNNVASSQGGGVYGGNVYRSVISKNTASGDGGGAYAANLTDCTIENNLSSGSGGGALLTNYTATRCAFLRNRARSHGGGVYGGTCNYCGITNNIATSYGGGAYNITGNNTAITSNRAASGGGTYNGTYNFCTLEANASSGDGGGACYGTFNDSLVFRNEAQGAGGGMCRSTFYRTRIIENTSCGDGGGAYNGTGYNSLIVRNKGLGNGGGTCSGYNYNCTITENWCGGNGGGTNGGYLYNTIIVDNADPDGEYNQYGSSCYNSPASNADDPMFVNPLEGDYRLRVGSPCINAGNNSYANGSTDLALATRIQGGTVDMGAYEGGVEGFVIAVDSVGVGGLEYGSSLVTNGGSFAISAHSQGRTFLHFLTNGVVATTSPIFTLDSISSDVKLTAVFAHEMFVDGTAGNDGNDGLAWATAKKTIQAAIDDSVEGDTIWVADGVYAPIRSSKRINIVSLHGAAVTSIDGEGRSGCAVLDSTWLKDNSTGTRLSGFTICNGAQGNGAGVQFGMVDNCIIENCHATGHGGGVDFSTVSNCIIRNNTAQDYGGGLAVSARHRIIDSKIIGNFAGTNGGGENGNGVFRNCEFIRNAASGNGGAMYDGVAYDSLITGNRAAAGGATYNGTFYRCNLSGNTSTGDGGGAYYGTFYDSTISDNYASGTGGGLYRSTYWRSSIMGNASNGEGGGVYNGTGYSSLIVRNKTIGGGSGGGTSNGYTYNCTVYGNYTGYYGGGTYNGYHYNSIIWGNENGGGANNTSGGSFYSCSTGNPMFVDVGANDFRLRIGSPCLNAGNSSYVNGNKDMAGMARVQDGTIDVGAYEGAIDGFVVGVRTIGSGDVECSSIVVGKEDSFTATAHETNRAFLHFTTNGIFATDAQSFTLSGITKDISVTAVFVHEMFVDGASGNDSNDGFSWTTAKKTIQAAINVSLDGDTIWVADGVYEPISTSNKRIDIVSVNGQEKTVIDGGNSTRCVTLGSSTTHDASRISGFTIRNGYSSDGGGARYGRVDNSVIENCRATNNGGGVNDTSISNCIVRNNTALNGGGASIYHRYRRMDDCIFSGNTAQNYGGGAYGGTARNCSFTGNIANSHGGGMSDCFAYNSKISRNRSPSGGGTYEVIAYNSAIFNNISTGDGGGAYYGTLYDSVISNNTASASGGGLYRSTYWRCHVVGNMATSEGGGIYNGTGYSSLIVGNRTNGSGGGTSSGYTYNCTITENYNASGNGGGAYNGYHYNSLIWGNSNGYGHYNTQGGSYYSCKTSNPLFVNASEGDYRLRAGSSCINAGSSSYVQGSLDLARNTRVQGGTIDIGAYEGSVDGYVITVVALGIENVLHSSSLVESNGTLTVYSVTGGRPFVGIYTNKVFASSTLPFSWTGICADGELTVKAANDLFVDANEGNDSNDGLSRDKAKQSIQAAIDISMSGDVIHVADGWYEPFRSGNRAIRIKSDNGPDNCTVYGDYLSRCATLGSQASDVDTMIDGLTLSCGYSSSGGGCCYGTAVDCIIEDCYSTGNGGGAYGTMLKGCSLVGNVANSSGGGSYGSRVVASKCVFEDNISYGDGGGVYNGCYYDCTFDGNRAYSTGGASYDATLQRCVIRNNQAANGGGTRSGTIYSSLYHDNYASSSGGGAYQGTLRNCTVTRNKAAGSPAGVYSVTAYNTIVWGNYLNSGSRSEYSSGSYYYCCLNTTSTGTSTLASDPLFVDANRNDFRLSKGSPCLNRGSASYVSESTDLLGNARTQDGTVDIGCYEGAFSVAEETQTTPKPVPYSWLNGYPEIMAMFGGDYEAMGNAPSPGASGSGKIWSDGSPCYVWQDFVAGTSPTNDAVFTAMIRMEGNTPIVTWEPDTSELRATRVYRILGKKTLLDANWTEVTDKDLSEYHFFKVTVDLP